MGRNHWMSIFAGFCQDLTNYGKNLNEGNLQMTTRQIPTKASNVYFKFTSGATPAALVLQIVFLIPTALVLQIVFLIPTALVLQIVFLIPTALVLQIVFPDSYCTCFTDSVPDSCCTCFTDSVSWFCSGCSWSMTGLWIRDTTDRTP